MLDSASLLKAASEHETPFYLYDLQGVTQAFLDFKEAFKGHKSLICYALKANSNLKILQTLAKEGAGADCVSLYEVQRALLAGIPAYKIIFSGAGKLEEEIKEALRLKILFLNVESFAELKRIEQIASEQKTPARISVRLNPNIDAITHPYISTGLFENKFGVEEKEAVQMFMFAKQSPFLEPVGLHCHIGSQLNNLEPLRQACIKLADLARFLIASGIDLKFLDVGGGLGVDYSQEQDQTTIALNDYSEAIKQAFKGLDCTTICEPGRRIIAPNGVLITRVQYIKHRAHKCFAIVDAGMNDFLRPALYQASHPIKVLKEQTSTQKTYDIVGPVCESADCFAKSMLLPEMQEGDLIVFYQAGAYGSSMASRYNSRPQILELGISKEGIAVLREREDFLDLILHELGALEGGEITKQRVYIDSLDRKISALLHARFACTYQIAKQKHKQGMSIYNPVRENAIFNQVGKDLESIYTEILGVSRSLVSVEKIGLSGLVDDARMVFGRRAQVLKLNPEELFKAIEARRVDFGFYALEKENLAKLVTELIYQRLKIVHSFTLNQRWYFVLGRGDFSNPSSDSSLCALWFASQEEQIQPFLKTLEVFKFLATKEGVLVEINALALQHLPTPAPILLGNYSSTRRELAL
ncbi:diaminopimelate decarboxylase [Helicobacter suis]|uniref:diaminopimelate decarboxylase n=1 Tax=Helicobacter suis TaxID=104628 RepID=UPI0013D71723|nr:diaminopimelate decarboxylase [Helicobacter suis]